MLLLKQKPRRSQEKAVWFSVQCVLLLVLHQLIPLCLLLCCGQVVESCSHDYLKQLPTDIAGRIDSADMAVLGNVRSIYPYEGTEDPEGNYVVGLIVICVLKANDPDMYDLLSGSYIVNISNAGTPGTRDKACKLERKDDYNDIVFLEGSRSSLTLSSPPILSHIDDPTNITLAATACTYRKSDPSNSQHRCPDPDPKPDCPTTTTTTTTTVKQITTAEGSSDTRNPDDTYGDQEQSVQTSSSPYLQIQPYSQQHVTQLVLVLTSFLTPVLIN